GGSRDSRDRPEWRRGTRHSRMPPCPARRWSHPASPGGPAGPVPPRPAARPGASLRNRTDRGRGRKNGPCAPPRRFHSGELLPSWGQYNTPGSISKAGFRFQMSKSAAILVIGDEILSGRTQDTNSGHIARVLGSLGIALSEIRVVGDVEGRIVEALNALRAAHDLVFTTGGIGPTHDDITADAVAKAFGVSIDYHPEAYRLLEARYPPGEFNEARKRMARIPEGAALIPNAVSVAPGFHIGNV